MLTRSTWISRLNLCDIFRIIKFINNQILQPKFVNCNYVYLCRSSFGNLLTWGIFLLHTKLWFSVRIWLLLHVISALSDLLYNVCIPRVWNNKTVRIPKETSENKKQMITSSWHFTEDWITRTSLKTASDIIWSVRLNSSRFTYRD